jgi:GT2 family glycosyltransferase
MHDLSVVIPFKEDILNLKLCLDSLKNQRTKYLYEIIIIDDGSSKEYRNEIESLRIRDLRYFYQKNKGPAGARNFGIKKARSLLIALIDSDCIPKKDWINRIVELYKKNRNLEITGGKIEIDKNNVYALASQYLTSNAMYDNVEGEKQLIFMPTCNMIIKKDIFEKIGYFDEDFRMPAGEDLEFCWRAFKKNVNLHYDEKITVFHNLGNSLRSYTKQAFRYGRGNYLVKIKHPNHPELKSIRTGGRVSFYFGCLIDLIDGPRFAWVFTSRIRKISKESISYAISVYVIYLLHKIYYVLGNIKGLIDSERIR